MVRQKSRKTVEDLYSAPPAQPPLATSRFDETFFQNSKNMKCNKVPEKHEFSNLNVPCRKKIKGGTIANQVGGAEKKDEKTFINEERLHGKAAKSKKPEPFPATNLDNKMNFVEETEKDEDTEEFFELIKETVENAVGKTLSDILNRNFREVSAKIDGLKEQLHANELKLEKIQADMNNKIVHYGEENSRHFRYLCMKSEYDKMFYQHQNIMAAIPVEARPNVINPYPQPFVSPGAQPGQVSQQPVHLQQPMPPQTTSQPPSMQLHHPQSQMTSQQSQQSQPTTQSSGKNAPTTSHCNCHNQSGCGDFDSTKRSKSSVSSKSSDIGIKEVKDLLEQLQRYYEHQQAQEKDIKKESRDITLNIDNDSGDDDDDESSDELSTPSIEEKLDDAGGDS